MSEEKNYFPISQELFADCIKAIQEQDERENKFAKGLSHISDGYAIIHNLASATLVKLLEKLTNDEDEWIEWYLYDNIDHKV
ncbi:MAG: hypothetical protein LBD41_05160, partial [Clostridiales Family XIII bacterium]|nr:hypothetical protein [Clostridiales Family XIII bacterium]